jgi:hypothetical protein
MSLLRQLRISKVQDGPQNIIKMTIDINMQGWYAVIADGSIIAAFPEYEAALVYRNTMHKGKTDIIIERIQHRKS